MKWLIKSYLLFFGITLLAQPNRDCRSFPAFLAKTGLDLSKTAFSTSENKKMGLNAIELNADGSRGKTWQHPSWKKAGWLGAFVVTETGDIWVAPTPVINTLHNPPAEQNRLWKVHNQTGEMTVMVDLPCLSSGNPHQNPYGLLGLGYDCDTRVLYATSVAGSTREAELGRIFALRASDHGVVATLDSLDGFGIGIGTIANEKRLYFGKARTSEVFSIALAADGGFVGAARRELSLDNLGPRGDDRARKIRFAPDGTMTVTGIEFYFNLTAPTERQETVYQFKYNLVQQKWVLTGVQ
jgi:hypothetical protein